MSSPLQENGRLDGWKAISDHLGWHVRTVMRWEQQRGLPIHRVPGGQRHAVFAFRHELDEWLKSGQFNQEDLEFSPNPVIQLQQLTEIPASGSRDLAAFPGSRLVPKHSKKWPNYRRAIWCIAGLLLLTVAGFTLHSLAFPPRIQFTGTTQLTGDGALKQGLVTDGRTVYFGERQNSRMVLAAIPIEGGPVRTIPTPFVQVVPEDVSPDGKNLLVRVSEGIEMQRTLWIMPTAGGQPRQVGRIRCQAAAWSPDGRRIAFSFQNAIYVTDIEGASIQQVQAFDSAPVYLHWTHDGRRLLLELRDMSGPTTSFWELTFSDRDRNQVSSLVPLKVGLKDCWVRTMALDASGRSFIAGGECNNQKVYLLEKHRASWNSAFDLLGTNAAIPNPMYLALDSSAKRLIVLSDSAIPRSNVGPERRDLLKFDIRTHEIKPFLPGIAAGDVDFSRDGRSIAYIRESDQTLWISGSDGAGARQIKVEAIHLELPRWSPDGQWIAFMADCPGKPWRIFVVPSSGGTPRAASLGTDNQGAPTWSPDGKWLVYGNVECQEVGTCAIQKLELSTGRTYTIPGSEALGTARWSPNGRYIAALNPVRHEVWVFSLTKQRWQKLFDGVNGNDLSWSADSRSLYASRPTGDQPEIIQISLNDAKVQTAVDLRSFTALTGHINTWFTLAPDRSIIFLREISGVELYSLSYVEQ